MILFFLIFRTHYCSFIQITLKQNITNVSFVYKLQLLTKSYDIEIWTVRTNKIIFWGEVALHLKFLFLKSTNLVLRYMGKTIAWDRYFMLRKLRLVQINYVFYWKVCLLNASSYYVFANYYHMRLDTYILVWTATIHVYYLVITNLVIIHKVKQLRLGSVKIRF